MSVYRRDNPTWLRLALDSIYNQSFPPEEVVIVQDGFISHDLSTVINDFAFEKKNIISLIKPQNQGLGLALRDGLSYVSTKWVARMDADDISLPDRFEKQIKYLKRHLDVNLLGGQICEFENNPCKTISQRIVPIDKNSIAKFIKWRNPFNHMTVMMEVEAVKRAGNYCNIKGFEDYDLWNRMLATGCTFHNLADSLVMVRVGNEMYKRRGGIRYLQRYVELKSNSQKLGIINKKEALIADMIMFINIIIPAKIRALVYKEILRI